jgi:hypothetical protein
MRAPRPWSYISHPVDCAPEALGAFAPLVALWQERRGGRLLPCWGDFDIIEFAGWHDMMMLDEVSHDPIDALTVIWGSRLAEVSGYQARGTRMRESAQPRGLIADDFTFLERICTEPCIGLACGALDWRGREHVTIEQVHLPCAPEGGRVDRVVSFCRLVRAAG